MKNRMFLRTLSCRPLLPGLLGLSVMVAACDPDAQVPVEPRAAALSVEKNLNNVAANLSHTTGFLAESQAIAETLASLGMCANEAGEGEASCEAADCVDAATPSTPASCDAATVKADIDQMNVDMDKGIKTFIEDLKTKVLVEANIESRSETEIVYRLPARVLCDSMDAMMPDLDCEQEVQKGEPRLRVTSPEEGDIDMAVLLTPRKLAAMTGHINKDRVGVTVDLANLFASMAEMDPDATNEVAEASGQIQLMLVRRADKVVALEGSVLEDVRMVMLDPEDPQARNEVSLDATSRTYELVLDAQAKTIGAKVNLGGLSVTIPMPELGDVIDAMPSMKALASGDVAKFVLGGLNGSLTFDGNKDTFAFKGMGLGDKDSSLSVNGKTLFALDINRKAGRRFDMTMSMAQTSRPLLTFSPGLELSMFTDFSSVADHFDEDLPAFMLGDTTTLSLQGMNPSVREGDEGLEVVSGTLTLQSTREPSVKVTVDAGMCLVDVEQASSSQSPVTAVASGACTQTP